MDNDDKTRQKFPKRTYFQEIVPCTYQVMNQSVRILISTLFDFAAALFPEFMELSLAEKVRPLV